ncbi:MAG TPA: nucleotidyltransferase domain-containing protein [Ktedonobacteraceae bacterium]|nr:nucleotidyltransferase domain-containing protein [Ktedonobacteraceae bacterium]
MQNAYLLQKVIEQLQPVRGLNAIVLGGSYASGTHQPDSDLDIGLYYYEKEPLDTAHIRSIANSLNDKPAPVVTELGGWGPWVNGGAWLTIQGQRVDFLYRNIDFVSSTLDDCNRGIIHSDFWQQPAYGFHNFMYCTETVICRPLYDPGFILDPLKAKVSIYSPKLKQAIIERFIGSAKFTFMNTYKSAERGEVYRVTGCLTRIVHCLILVLYALNETWYLSEKRVAEEIDAFRLKPENFIERSYAILGMTGTTNGELMASLKNVEKLYEEIVVLIGTR